MEEYVKLSDVLKMLYNDFREFHGDGHLLLAIQHALELSTIKLNADKSEE